MTSLDPNPPPKNLNNELAKERNRAASERTLMAWIRTCLSLIGFGFGIDQIVTVIYEETGDNYVNPLRLSRFLGLSFIALGTLALIAASIDHRQELKRICRDDYLYTPRISQALTVAVILAILGVVAFLGIMLGS
ncbi:MAG: DUF202 domain-containing protein [Limnospira sp. PMC 1291.21]|uniref:DUF202 domain-containing protein n=3 Tax=Limnospira TaxID=2596745 RepID=A0A9P1KDM1_9CYAN|nr:MULTISPECIES: DUF202 domain-containing protein [Limnospira]EKD11235.1 hypothetical protein SPLC1_S030650 [Arthrospira platensis C1]MDC0838880.1 DUF202 domain-containing protein [Limnoraphis robusta]MDY7052971.1 DUF202 domain-containing protein [Limnospira fusiformis LS22]EDZ94332.1 protein of unknown function DUF202 [Limnospira maxima CS-328]MDT9177129.1 DUF202 domain-containing protein [Limnospira sp. PMC 1238.20]